MSSTLEVFTSQRLGWAVGIIALTVFIRFWQKLHYHRGLVKGIPGPPHSYLFGHIISMGKVVAKQPKHAAPQTLPFFVQQEYGLGQFFALDVWPFGPTMFATFLPQMMDEIAVKSNQPKHPLVGEFMENFGGDGNMVASEGAEWKKWRSAFNPGFSASHLMTMVPAIIDQCAIFSSLMTEHAKKNDLFRMETAATRLTVDIIGKVVLDTELNSQVGPNELVSAFISQTRWQPVGVQFRPLELIDWRIPFVQAYNNWRMNRYLGRCLDERFAQRQSRDGGKKQKHVIDLALEAYMKEVKGNTNADVSKVTSIDPAFRQAAIANVKTFVFAGHDTTSSTICYCYYYMSKNSSILAKVRAEHDSVFGSDPVEAANLLKDDARLLNKLEYTTAVIKEVLRLQPPASTIRLGTPGFFVHDPDTGEAIKTEGMMLWPVDTGIHRSPLWGPDVHTFRPERFLDPNSNKDAYVPFSRGPRNCIGQELAMIETKVILAMTVRNFEFESAYGEVEKLKGDGSGYPSETGGCQEQWGEEAYQIQLGTAKPREGMPCRLRERRRG